MANIDLYSTAAADNQRLVRSKTWNALADGTYNILRVPRYAFVSDVWLRISTAFAGTGSPIITVGWLGNGETAAPAGFMSNDISKPLETGVKRAQRDTLVSFPGKWFDNGPGVITVTVDDDGCATKAVFIVFASYTVIM